MKVKKTGENSEAGLGPLRAEINECDRQINRLLVRRFELVKQVGRYKAAHNLPVLDEAREKELLAERKSQTPADTDSPVEEIFKLILEQSRRIQMELRLDAAGGSDDRH